MSFLFFSSCHLAQKNKVQVSAKTSEQIEQDPPTIYGKWDLTNFYKQEVSIDRTEPSFVPTLRLNEGAMNIYGDDGCNQIYATLEKLDRDVHEIKINAIGGTKVGCLMKDSYDQLYRRLLQAAQTYSVTGTSLTLFDSWGE